MPLKAFIEKSDLKHEDFRDKIIILGISMNNAAMQDEHLAAALELFKQLKVKEVILLIGSELIRYMLAAEQSAIKQKVSPDDPDIFRKAFAIGNNWREAPEQECVIRQMRDSHFPVDVRTWSNFSSDEDFKYFINQINMEYKRNIELKRAVDNTASKYLLKQIKKKKKELYDILSAVLFPMQYSYSPANSFINTVSLQALQSELKRAKSSQEQLFSQRDLHTSLREMWLDIQFLRNYFGLPCSSVLYSCFGICPYTQAPNYTNMTQKEHMLLLKTWIFLVNLFNSQSNNMRLIKLLQVPSEELNQELERILIYSESKVEQGNGKILLEQEDLIHQWKNRIPNKQALDKLASEKALFGLVDTIDARLPPRSSEGQVISNSLSAFLAKYQLKINRIEFIIFLRELIKEEKNRQIVVNILEESLKSMQSFGTITEFLFNEFSKLQENDEAYRILRKLFATDEDLFCFLFKAIFVEEGTKKSLENVFFRFKELAPSTDENQLLQNIAIILREELLVFFPWARESLLLNIELFEKAYSENMEYCLRVYLHSFLLTPSAVYTLVNDSFVLAVYKYLNDRLTKLFKTSELECLTTEQLAMLIEDDIAKVLFEGSIRYILDECGGLPYIAYKLKAQLFAYPRYIIEALSFARKMEFQTLAGEAICLESLGLIKCVTYNFKEDRTKGLFLQQQTDEPTTAEHAFLTVCGSSFFHSSQTKSKMVGSLLSEEELASLRQNYSALSSDEREEILGKIKRTQEYLVKQQECLAKQQAETFLGVTNHLAMLSKTAALLLSVTNEKAKVECHEQGIQSSANL